MALSQDEQRMLAEIERRLAGDDPGLASCLTTFRRPGPAAVLRSPRARIIGSLFTVLLVAMISLMIYAMIPFRAHIPRHAPPTASASANTAVATGSQSGRTQMSSADASTGSTSTTSQSVSARALTATATGKTQQGSVKPANMAIMPATNP